MFCYRCEVDREDYNGEFHTCPYQEDVNNDSESECDCCSECEHECMMDI